MKRTTRLAHGGGGRARGRCRSHRPWVEALETRLTPAGGPLLITGGPGDNTLVITASDADSGTYRLNNGPATAFSGITALSFQGGAGNDVLIINNPGDGLFAPADGISFDGGGQDAATGGDSLQILGGAHTTETHSFAADGASGHNGSVALVNGALTANYTYTGLEPILVNAGSPADVVFNLPPGTVGASLQDDGTAGNGTVQLASTNAAFETTTFIVPTGSLTVNAGGDTDTITTAAGFSADFNASLTINGKAASDTVTLNTLALGNAGANAGTLQVTANTINVKGALDTSAGTTGALLLSAAATLSGAAAGNITARGTTVALAAGGTGTIAGVIGGAANSITLNGAGRLTLPNANTYGGATTVNGGTLANGITNALPVGTALNVAGGATYDMAGFNQTIAAITGPGTVTDTGAAATLTVHVTDAIDTFPGLLTGNLGLVKTGKGRLTLTSANTYTGATAISNGLIWNGIANALPVGTALTVDGAYELAGFDQTVARLTGTGTVTSFGAPNLTVNNAVADEFDGVLIAGFRLTKSGAGTLTLGTPARYSTTTVSAGTLVNGAVDAVGGYRLTVATGATYDLSGFDQSVGTVWGAGVITDSGAAAIFTAGNSTPGIDTFDGSLNGANLALTMAGAGTLRLTGVSPFGGPTLVSAGTLLVEGSHPNSPVTVSKAATLAGNGRVAAVTIKSGGRLDSGDVEGPGPLTGVFNTGDLTLQAGVNLDLELNGTTPGSGFDQIGVTGAVNLDGATLNVTLGFESNVGDQFPIINNDGADAVTGTFNGLPEGATFTLSPTANPASTETFRITYTGGDGNDVVLRQVATTPGMVGLAATNGHEGTTAVTASGTISDPDQSVTAFTVTIDWGDGTVQSFPGQPRGPFTRSHVYAEEGPYTITATVSDNTGDPNGTRTESTTATVLDEALIATGIAVATVEGQGFSGPVASFGDTDPDGTPADYTATIVWGDGSSSPGRVTADGRDGFLVSGAHTYPQGGTYQVRTSIDDAGGSSVVATSTADVADAPLSLAGTTLVLTEGASFNGLVATFTDANPLAAAADFSATIAWADGQTSTGTVSAAPGGFIVSGAHAYAVAGLLQVRVTVQDRAGASATGTSLASVTSVQAPPALLGAVARILTHGAEGYGVFVTQAYQRYLGRTPDAFGLGYWVYVLQQGWTDERVEAGFLAAPEYIADHGGDLAGWVEGMYRDLHGRTPASEEVGYWTAVLQGGYLNTEQVAYGFAASAERESLRVQADYETYLGRSARPDEVAYWRDGFLHGGLTNEDVTAGFLASAEYFDAPAKAHGAVDAWVRASYQDALHRAAGPDEVAYWSEVLN